MSEAAQRAAFGLRRHRPVPRPAEDGRRAGRERPRRGRRDHRDQRLRQADRPRGREAEPGQRPPAWAGSWSSTRRPTASSCSTRGSSRSTRPAVRRAPQRRRRPRWWVRHRHVEQRLPGQPRDRVGGDPLGCQDLDGRRGRHVQPGRRRPDRHRYRHRRDEQDRLGDRGRHGRPRPSTSRLRRRSPTSSSRAAARSPSPARPSRRPTPSRSTRSRRSAPRSGSRTPSRVCTCTARRSVRPEALVVASVKVA
jgi:hypothetical protein